MADKALTRLYAAHWRGIRAYLTRRLHNAAMAEDVAQEAFLRLAEQAPLEDVSNPRAWLYRTAHNLAVDQLRQQARRRTEGVDLADLAEITDDQPSTENVVGARHALDRLTEVIEELPERTKQVFVLTRIDGLTYDDAARRLGISSSSVQKHLARALRHVMTRIGSN